MKKYQIKAKGYSFYNLEVPILSTGEEGNKVTFILDYPLFDDVKTRKLLSGNQGVIFNNILFHACRDCKEAKLSQASVINYIDADLSGVHGKEKEYLTDKFVKRIEKHLLDFNPDSIVFCGSKFHEKILKDYTGEKYFQHYNRVFKATIGERSYPSVASLDVNFFAIDGDDLKTGTMVSRIYCAGEPINHYSLAIYGKNRYVMPLEAKKLAKDPIIVDTIDKFDKFYEKLISDDNAQVSIDTETKNLQRIANTMLTFQATLDGYKAYVFAWQHQETPWTTDEFLYIKEKMKWYFEYGKSRWHIYQNAVFDLCVLTSAFDIKFYSHRIWDVSAGEFSLDENRRFLEDAGFRPYRLDTIELKYGIKRPKDILGKDDRKNMASMPLHDILMYGAYDVIGPWWITQFQLMEAKRRGAIYRDYENSVAEQISDMIHSFAVMSRNGFLVDRRYLMEMSSKDRSFLFKRLQEIQQEFRDSKAARKVNKKLLEKKGIPTGDLFSNKRSKSQTEWVFDINKDDHKKSLFFEELELEPVEFTAKTGQPGVGKKFIEKYKSTVKEVDLFSQHVDTKKNYTAFIKKIWSRLIKDLDARVDGRLRATYHYLRVLTGRASVTNPNFQQIPSRTKLSKDIKRQFIPPEGLAFIKVDYSAHEVVCWCNISKDFSMRKTLHIVRTTIRKFRLATKNNLEKAKERVKTHGDMHILNVKFFFNKVIDKSDPLRQGIKATVFGVMYGKGSKSLSIDLNESENYAQELIDKLFSMWKAGGNWINEVKNQGRKLLRVKSPVGRVRHLWGYVHTNNRVIAAMDRRGPNSIVQGYASDLGFKASRIIQETVWNWFHKHKKSFYLQQNNAVHDSLEIETKITEIPLSLYIIEHAMTTQVAKKCKKIHGDEFIVDLDVEFELGGSLGHTFEWNGRYDDLSSVIEKVIDWQIENLGYNLDKVDLMNKINNNISIVKKYRTKELKNIVGNKKHKIATEMLINEKNIQSLGFTF